METSGPSRRGRKRKPVQLAERVKDAVETAAMLLEAVKAGQDATELQQKFERSYEELIGSESSTSYEINRFAFKVRSYLNELGWTNEDLAAHIGVSRSLVGSWLSEGSKLPSKADVGKVVWALVGGQDGVLRRPNETPPKVLDQPEMPITIQKNPWARRGRGDIAFIADELLRAAGYVGVEGQAENRVWERLSGATQISPDDSVTSENELPPRLRIGYVESRPLLYWRAEGDADEGPDGLAAEITRQLASYLGVRLRWIPSTWANIGRRLRQGQIDLVAPMALHFPKRMIDMRFTRGLPGLRCGINCIVNKDYLHEISRTKSEPKDIDEVDFDRVAIGYTTGNVGAWARALFAPRDKIKAEKRVDKYSSDNRQHVLATTASRPDWADLIERPKEEKAYGRVRCYLTGQLVCSNAVRLHPDQLKTLLPLEQSKVKLPYAFGVSHTEPRLFDIIDSSLKVIFEDSALMRSLYRRALADLDELDDAGVLEREQAPFWLIDLLKLVPQKHSR